MLCMVLQRVGIEFHDPWRDFGTFYNHWKMKRCAPTRGKYAGIYSTINSTRSPSVSEHEARAFQRNLPTHQSALAIGWGTVDEEIDQVGTPFPSAHPQDYRAEGTHSVAVPYAPSRTVYGPDEASTSGGFCGAGYRAGVVACSQLVKDILLLSMLVLLPLSVPRDGLTAWPGYVAEKSAGNRTWCGRACSWRRPWLQWLREPARPSGPAWRRRRPRPH